MEVYESSLYQTVFIRKGHNSEVFLFLRVMIPKFFLFQMSSYRKVIIPKGLYPEWSLFRKVIILKFGILKHSLSE